jgi:general secretion pathway protein L
MARRFIGIDIDARHLRAAILAEERGGLTLEATLRRPRTEVEELTAALAELLGERHLGDRLAAALPAGEGFVRQLQFPFAEPRQLAAALDFELAAQLPVPIEECLTDYRQPLAGDDGCRVTAAAVRSAAIAAFLAPFEAAELPLQTLELAPFAGLAALPAGVADALLACLGEREASLSLVLAGRLVDYRLLPLAGTPAEDALPRFLPAAAAALQAGAGRPGLPLLLFGPGATPELAQQLGRRGFAAELLLATAAGRTEAEYLPAVALALRAAAEGKEKAFNFRRGAFALRSEWAALRRGLVAAAILLGLALSAFGAAAWLGYSSRAARAEALSRQLEQAFRQSFPGTPMLADVSAQMQSKLAELQKRARLLGSDRTASALAVLAEISRRLPPELKVDLREVDYQAEGVRLEGYAPSFDVVNRATGALQQSPLFREVQLLDAKTSLDGSRVDFRLSLPFAQEPKP